MSSLDLAAKDVFAPGSFPKHTFNDRLQFPLQSGIETYLQTGDGSCLIVYGASKTGKTVLIEKWWPPTSAIWVKGDEIDSVDDLYRRIIDDLDLFVEVSRSTSRTKELELSTGGEGSTPPLLAGFLPSLKFTMSGRGMRGNTKQQQQGRSSLSVSVVKEALRDKPVPIVIDDYHFMNSELRQKVARAVKDLVRLTQVVVIAIPHHAFDAMRRLPDMDWRMIQLEVQSWERGELEQIATDGFALLNIQDFGGVVTNRLAAESRGAPFIMQALCLQYVAAILRMQYTASPAREAVEPIDWAAFLAGMANSRKPLVFDSLLNGKDPRGTKRAPRSLRDGRTTDIYGVVLLALSRMGAFGKFSKHEVGARMASLMDNAPTPSTISGTLGYLADIAEDERGDSDPALTYRDPELEVLDPFLSFYLANADWKLPDARR